MAAIVVNYLRDDLTRLCLDSLLASSTVPGRILLIDNGVGEQRAGVGSVPATLAVAGVEYLPLAENLGFAGACNAGFEHLLADPRIESILLLNNDARIASEACARMQSSLNSEQRVDMVAAHMHEPGNPAHVDSLGIVLFSCGIAANRKQVSEPLLGPCGGAALYSTRLLRELKARTGMYFESRYFCYAEDTDLALRARLLGYGCALADDAWVEHEGSATSGGSDSDFVMYHGLRNSLSSVVRCLPAGFLLRYWPKLLVLQAMLLFKYLRVGRLGLLLKVWRDVARELPNSLRMRRRLRAEGLLRWASLADVVDRRFYQSSYISAQLRRLFGARLDKPPD